MPSSYYLKFCQYARFIPNQVKYQMSNKQRFLKVTALN